MYNNKYSGSINARCIGIYDGKNIDEDKLLKMIDYYVKDVMLLEDFENGELNGYPKENPIVLNCRNKVENITINGNYVHHDVDNDDFDIEENITKAEEELLDSLEEGDVIVFDYYAPINGYWDNPNEYNIDDFYSEVKNIEKYNDKYAADEIKLIINDAPLKHDYSSLIDEH